MKPPPWLEAFQADFSSLLRAPLDSSSGTFREHKGAYAAELLAQVKVPSSAGKNHSTASDRLALYHRQYWMRLFTALQSRFPRLSLALGYFRFNQLCSCYLIAHPSISYDIDAIGDDFPALVRTAVTLDERGLPLQHHASRIIASKRGDRALVLEALNIDVAERKCFQSAFEPRWNPTAVELRSLPYLKLEYAASFQLVHETWSLVHRSTLTPIDAKSAPTSGSAHRLPSPRHWVFVRSEAGIGLHGITPACANFLALCQQYSFGDALRRLEQQATPQALDDVRANLSSWVQAALEFRFWIGAAPHA
jgi:hypothetical protein